MSTQRTLTVELGERSYPIVIGNGLLGRGFDLTGYLPGDDCLIVSNDTVLPLYGEALQQSLGARSVETISLPDGEQFKTLATMSSIIDRLVSVGARRDTTVIALGGGVVGDIAGYAAASYMRGVGFIQVPTTLLAQVDSSVGGKTGVNHALGKNLIGAFYQPAVVLIDTDTLTTLPDREFRAGLAEVIKYGAIADAGFFAWLEANIDALLARDPAALTLAINRSCELKAQVVAEDERESGRRAILNFGHTFGHAIEHCQGYGDWLHGEAVAAGMIMAAELSQLAGAEKERLRALIKAAGLPSAPPTLAGSALLEAMGRDKKVERKALRFVLLERLGGAFVTSQYDEAALARICEAAQK
ncbi:MAG: 3-dehydroquinate synthase [Gammaproteobacteria bacterium]|nr:3-dehydroquinate synthase [Gammaproteobacteria bacterium]